MKRVLVLDAAQRSALAVTRSLGRQGADVYTAEEGTTALASCSRHSKQFFSYPSPRLQPDNFVCSLAELVRDQRIDMLLPMTELTTTLILNHKGEFNNTTIPLADPSRVESLMDKCTLMRKAKTLGVPVPRTWYSNENHSPPDQDEFDEYPVILKPGKSWNYLGDQWQRAGVHLIDNYNTLLESIQTDPVYQSYPYMVQERVDGEGQGVFALYDQGRPLAFFAHRRLREKPPSGGVSVLSESIAVDPVLEGHARRLLDDAGWHGVAMVEFKVAADGTAYLMEINTRFWGSLQLAVDAGVDFPALLYKMANGENPATFTDYRTGRRLRWLLGDLDNLYLTLRDKDSYTPGEKLDAIMKFMTPSPFRTRHEVNRWSDPGPGWCELKQYFRDCLG